LTDLPNIVLIVLDTMRKDVLPVYAGRANTPHLDLLARDGTAYKNCIAPSPWTVPSHASLFTGKYPSQHGVHESRELKIPRTFDLMGKAADETVVGYAKDRGYNTIGFSANPSVAPGSGFDDSFNSFTLFDPTRGSEKDRKTIEWASKFGDTRQEVRRNLIRQGRVRELWRLYRTSKEMQRRESQRNYPMVKGGDALAGALAESSFEQPFFLFINLFEMHEPYLKDEPTPMMELFGKKTIGDSMIEAIRKLYVEETNTVDSFLGSIVDYIKKCGAYDESLIVITSDHGQELKEHGYYGHGTFLHREIVEVPLIVKYPGNRRPESSDGYQTLTRIPEMIKDCVSGITDGRSLSANNVIAESFGLAHGIEGVEDSVDFNSKRDRFDRPRKAIYQDGFRLVVDGAAGDIEEFDLQGKQVSPSDHKETLRDMLQKLQAIGGSNFKFPSPS
jgi:arylsulfatase A-like enzyme